MEILVGTPIILIYEHGTCTSNEALYYLGKHVYGWLTDKGFEAANLIDNAKYAVPIQHWNYDYLKHCGSKIDYNRFRNGFNYEDFLVDKVVDIDNPNLHEYEWYEDMQKSMDNIINFYAKKHYK